MTKGCGLHGELSGLPLSRWENHMVARLAAAWWRERLGLSCLRRSEPAWGINAGPSSGDGSIMNKTAISNNNNPFPSHRFKRQISFSKKLLTGFHSGGLGWSRLGGFSCTLTTHPGHPEDMIASRELGTGGHRRNSRSEQKSSCPEGSLPTSSRRHTGQNERFLLK